MSHPLIVIPTYNELENLRLLVPLIFEQLPHTHILVVDDNSPDGTGQLADELAAEDTRVFCLHRTEKEGLGRAYLAGFKWALARDYSHIFEMDADHSHEPSRLPDLLAATETADVALGSRWVKGGGTVGWPLKRRLLSRGGSFYARTVLGVGIRDLTGGFKCFRKDALMALELDSVQTVGYGFQIELTWRAIQAGLKVVEVPICFKDRELGQSKMSVDIFSEALSLVWKLRWARK
jgi:dolichol-phosphate mannosyltransferase